MASVSATTLSCSAEFASAVALSMSPISPILAVISPICAAAAAPMAPRRSPAGSAPMRARAISTDGAQPMHISRPWKRNRMGPFFAVLSESASNLAFTAVSNVRGMVMAALMPTRPCKSRLSDLTARITPGPTTSSSRAYPSLPRSKLRSCSSPSSTTSTTVLMLVYVRKRPWPKAG